MLCLKSWFSTNSCLLSPVLFYLKPTFKKMFLNQSWVKSKPNRRYYSFKTFNIPFNLHTADITWRYRAASATWWFSKRYLCGTHTEETMNKQILSIRYSFSGFPQKGKSLSRAGVIRTWGKRCGRIRPPRSYAEKFYHSTTVVHDASCYLILSCSENKFRDDFYMIKHLLKL